MQLQRQSIRVMEESHLLAGVIIHADWFTFNPYLRQLIHRLLHALHTKCKVTQPTGLRADCRWSCMSKMKKTRKPGGGRKKKHNRTLKLAKGYRGARSKQYRVAKQSVMRALTSSYAGRKQRKRQMRQLWIARINAAARMNGLSYSKFMHGLKLANVDMNRKMLAELAVSDKEGFATLAALAKEKVA